MIAVQGYYDNGILNLDIPAPVKKAKVIVVFPDTDNANKNREAPAENNPSSAIDFTKYMGHGKKMFANTEKTMDSLQLAVASIEKCDMFLTNDKQLKQFREVHCSTVEEWNI